MGRPMTPDALLIAAVFLFGMAGGAAIMRMLFGPDPDLDGPWDPYGGRPARRKDG